MKSSVVSDWIKYTLEHYPLTIRRAADNGIVVNTMLFVLRVV